MSDERTFSFRSSDPDRSGPPNPPLSQPADGDAAPPANNESTSQGGAITGHQLFHDAFPSVAAEDAGTRNANHPAERRMRKREVISAPVRVRSADAAYGGPDEISTTIDVSRTGFLFLTGHSSYRRGMRVAVTLPCSKVQSPAAIQAERLGRVARVHDFGDGRRAVAIAFGSAARAQPAGAIAPTVPREATTSPDTYYPDTKKALVLVVDADSKIRDSLKAYLLGEGYEVIAVHNSADGRAIMDMFTPALLIAEMEGEDLPGLDLCAHVKSVPRLQPMPVVLTTCSAYPSDYANAHSLGAVVCMAKPFKRERLGNIVRLLVPLHADRKHGGPPRPADFARQAAAPKSTVTDSAKRPGNIPLR